MKSSKLFFAIFTFLFVFAFSANAQDQMVKKGGIEKMHKMEAKAKTINLEQTEGAFTIQELTLAAGAYTFDIANNGVDREVGFVLVPQGQYDAANHIKEAYVQETVKKGATSSSKVVNLTPGVYEYFCPLNPTPKYTLTVK